MPQYRHKPISEYWQCCYTLYRFTDWRSFQSFPVMRQYRPQCETRRRSESAYIRQVHDNVMMYTSTRLHTCLPSNVGPMTLSIMTACYGVTGVCRKSIGNGVNIFEHCFSTLISILILTMSPESQENDVSNDILSEWKYSKLFTHESNTFLLNRFTDAMQRWRDLNC